MYYCFRSNLIKCILHLGFSLYTADTLQRNFSCYYKMDPISDQGLRLKSHSAWPGNTKPYFLNCIRSYFLFKGSFKLSSKYINHYCIFYLMPAFSNLYKNTI